MDVVENTIAEGYSVVCFQDVLFHGKDFRSVKRVIEGLNPNDKVFVDTGRHANDDIRKKKIYAGWGSSGMVSITLLHRAELSTSLCQKLEWRTGKDWCSNFGSGRVLWVEAITSSGKKVNRVSDKN